MWINTHTALYPLYLWGTVLMLLFPKWLHDRNERGLMKKMTEGMAYMATSQSSVEKHVLKLRFHLFNTPRVVLKDYTKSYLWTEIWTPIAAICTWVLWDFVFYDEFTPFGVRWALWWLDTYYFYIWHVNPALFYFPPTASCTHHAASWVGVIGPGHTSKTEFTCIIPANLLYQTVRF